MRHVIRVVSLFFIAVCVALWLLNLGEGDADDSHFRSLLKAELAVIGLAEGRVDVHQLGNGALFQQAGKTSTIQRINRSILNLGRNDANSRSVAADNMYLDPLLQCRASMNQYTEHVRVAAYIRPISMHWDGAEERPGLFNPVLIALPYWSENQYLLVSREQSDGWTQSAVICQANICSHDPASMDHGQQPCTQDELHLFGGQQGMTCATKPLLINIPSTPSKHCYDEYDFMANVAGFADPRIFWSGKGEPLMIMNMNSRYACLGLWIIDLRTVYPPLHRLLNRSPNNVSTRRQALSYSSLTELTRNPPGSGGMIEKNWVVFGNAHSSYVHYDLDHNKRTFAQLLGGGLTTPNLTDRYEIPCLERNAQLEGQFYFTEASWHQATPSLQLVLCRRNDTSCHANAENTVFWSLIHHKLEVEGEVRYDRFFVVWSSTPPFHMLAISSSPVIFSNETVVGFTAAESWNDDLEDALMRGTGGQGKSAFADFTYTPSMAYTWGRSEDGRPEDENIGYLDDEVIFGVGINDEAQGYVVVCVEELLQCMRVCPGTASEPLDGGFEGDDELN